MGKGWREYTMKLRYFIVFFISLLIIVSFFMYKNQTTIEQTNTQPKQLTSVIKEDSLPTKEVLYEDVVYTYDYFIVPDLTKLHLLPNFVSPSRGTILVRDNNCIAAANGGFYSTNNTPLGAFITATYSQENFLQSNLFNGFFGYSDTEADITPQRDTKHTTVLQSGPILIQNSSPLSLHINNDEHARRTVVGITSEKRVLFATIYIEDSIYNGPQLTDLPIIVNLMAKNLNISILTALNLDGGSATYFKTQTQELPELSSIGSLFCLQN